jgi:hypothetical protein
LERQERCAYTNTQRQSAEDNFCEAHRKTQKLVTVDYNQQMSTKGTEQLIAIQLVEHGSGQKNYFFTSWT